MRDDRQAFGSKALRIGVGIAVSAGLLVWVFHQVQFVKLWEALRQTSVCRLSLSVLFFGLSCVLRALMWRITTQPLGQAGFSVLFGGVVVGYLANNVLPLKAGEVVRAYYAAKRAGFPRAATFATVCLERLLDLFALWLFLAAGVLWGIQGLTLRSAGVLLGVLTAVVFLVVVLVIGLSRFNHSKHSFAGMAGRFLRWLEGFFKPLRQLKNKKSIFLLTILILATWGANYFSVLALTPCTGDARLQAALMLLLVINGGMMIPSSPGALGVMQAAFLMALVPFGVAREQSIALSFVYQGGLYFFTLMVGLPYLLRSHLKFSDMTQDTDQVE